MFLKAECCCALAYIRSTWPKSKPTGGAGEGVSRFEGIWGPPEERERRGVVGIPGQSGPTLISLGVGVGGVEGSAPQVLLVDLWGWRPGLTLVDMGGAPRKSNLSPTNVAGAPPNRRHGQTKRQKNAISENVRPLHIMF